MTKKIMKQAEENTIADRLKLASESIRRDRKIPDVAICDAIGDSDWFLEYCSICLQSPISNAFLGCILFGWQLCEEFNRTKSPTVYRA